MWSTDQDPRAVALPRGFALPAALLALLVIAALAAGAFVVARDEFALGANSRRAEQAFAAAEAGLGVAAAQGAAGGWGAVAPGDSATLAGTLPSRSGRFEATALRLDGRLFLVRASGFDSAGRIERRLALFAHLEGVAPGQPAAVMAGGPLALDGSAFVDGRDAVPPGWSGCDGRGLDTVAGVSVRGDGQLRLNGCDGFGCIAGRPPVLYVSVPTDSSAPILGGLSWTALVRLAGKRYAPGDLGGPHTPAPSADGAACDRDRLENWGEPARPAPVAGCTGYFPVVHAPGDFILAGGRGQGVLLVEGDLTLTGGAEFDGAVLVRGAVRATGAGGRVRGAVVVLGAGGGRESALASAMVSYSRCALEAALATVAPVRVLRERSWVELR